MPSFADCCKVLMDSFTTPNHLAHPPANAVKTEFGGLLHLEENSCYVYDVLLVSRSTLPVVQLVICR